MSDCCMLNPFKLSFGIAILLLSSTASASEVSECIKNSAKGKWITSALITDRWHGAGLRLALDKCKKNEQSVVSYVGITRTEHFYCVPKDQLQEAIDCGADHHISDGDLTKN